MNQQLLSRLTSSIDSTVEKYNYYLARYLNDYTIDIRATNDFTVMDSYGFNVPQDPDLSRPPSTNVIKSCVDTLVSMISTNHIVPLFTTSGGTPSSKKIISQGQKFIERLFESINIEKIMTSVKRDACIFGTGYVFVDPFNYKVQRVAPWTVGVVNNEVAYGSPKAVLVKFNNFPVSLLEKKPPKYQGREFCQRCIMVDLNEHKAYEIIDGITVRTEKWEWDIIPLAWSQYTPSVFGIRTTSLVRDLDDIQNEIDILNQKISAASQLSPANTTYVIEGSNIKTSDINNRTGNVMGVKLPPGMSQLPVQNVSPAPCDPSWNNLLDYYVKMAFEITGISQLNAQGKKQAGVNSAIMIQTMEDIQNDRFEIQLRSFIRLYEDLTNILITVMPDKEYILPPTMEQSSYTWGELKKERKLFRIKYTMVPKISRDASTASQQIMQMSQVGLIDVSKLADYIDNPDLVDAFNDARAIQSGIDKVIENAIEDGNFAIPDYVDPEGLAKEIAIQQNLLYSQLSDNKSDNEVRVALARLGTLEDIMIDKFGMFEDKPSMTGSMTSSQGMTAQSLVPALQPTNNLIGGSSEIPSAAIDSGEGAGEAGPEEGPAAGQPV